MALIPSPCETMMEERIGIIGNTQGVSASSRPAPKNKGVRQEKTRGNQTNPIDLGTGWYQTPDELSRSGKTNTSVRGSWRR